MKYSIIESVKEKLVGKSIKFCSSDTVIYQPYIESIPKSNGVTKKQFDGGNPQFRRNVTREKVIGRHKIFKTLKIIDVRMSYADWNGHDGLVLILENNGEHGLEVGDNLTEIEPNVFMLTN